MATHLGKIALAFAFAGAMAAQQAESGNATADLIVRAITVSRISTSKHGLPAIPFTAILNAWKANHVPLAVEAKLNPAALAQAESVIQGVYQAEGSPVRVEREVMQIPPRSSVEVKFRVDRAVPVQSVSLRD